LAGRPPLPKELGVPSSPRVRAILNIFNELDEESQEMVIELAQVIKRHAAHTKR
jgi:hypothetical protein